MKGGGESTGEAAWGEGTPTAAGQFGGVGSIHEKRTARCDCCTCFTGGALYGSRLRPGPEIEILREGMRCPGDARTVFSHGEHPLRGSPRTCRPRMSKFYTRPPRAREETGRKAGRCTSLPYFCKIPVLSLSYERAIAVCVN